MGILLKDDRERPSEVVPAAWLQLERALQLSADMQKRNVARNVHTHSALMNVCIKCGQLRLALECWENMQRDAIEPNVVRHWIIIATAF